MQIDKENLIPTVLPNPPESPPPPLNQRAEASQSWRRPDPQRHRRRHHRHSDALVFAPLAWAKLMFFLHAGGTEVGGFGVSSAADPLYVEEFRTVRQHATAVSVAFDDAAVADHFDACVDRGLKPERFARIWVHTHPGDSAEPSMVDERTFERVFGGCDWALMCIVSRGGRSYARLSFAAGPGAAVHLPLAVDWGGWPAAVLDPEERLERELAGWALEYERNVHPVSIATNPFTPDADPALRDTGGGTVMHDEERDVLYDAILEERLDGWRFDPWTDDVLQAAAQGWPEGTVWR